MNIKESLRLAFDGLRTNKLRSLLTMLGIIIGIASVIAILTAAKAMTDSVESSVDSLGRQNLYLYTGPQAGLSLDDLVINDEDMINDEKLNVLDEQFGHRIEGIAKEHNVSAGNMFENRRHESNVNLQGVSADTKKIQNIKLLAGDFFDTEDDRLHRNVVIISDNTAKYAFPDENFHACVGKEVSFTSEQQNARFVIGGVYEYEQDLLMGEFQQGDEKDWRTKAYIPYNTAMDLSAESETKLSSVIIMVAPDEDPQAMGKEIEEFFEKTYYENSKVRLTAESVAAMAGQLDAILGTLKMAVAFIAGISLLVGGIGVMNIMLVSVTERTREIGVRKALGATKNTIRTQFIVESIMVCLSGGIIGILLGSSIGFAASLVMKQPTGPSFGAVMLSVSFSVGIGLFFGYYPANKAAQMDPIEALRYE